MIAFLALIIAIVALGLAVIAFAFTPRVGRAGAPGPPGPMGLMGPPPTDEEIDAAIKRLAITSLVKAAQAQSVSRQRLPNRES